MENNDLKEKIRKNIKEKIAVSNIRKEFDIKNNKNKKIIYWITSSAAVFILGFGIIIGTNTFNNTNVPNQDYKIADLSQDKQNKEETLKIDLQINEIHKIGESKINGEIESISIDKIPEEIKFMERIVVPQNFNPKEIYKVYIRSNPNIRKYDLLHDYVFFYQKDEEHSIRIVLSTVGEPLRDYHIDNADKISKIGDIELKISSGEKMYIASFKIENIYFDIETDGITENELVELLKSIINESAISNNTNINVKDKDVGVKEQTNENTNTGYPEYYGGKYVNNNGNNVVWICEDNTTNRKEICKFLGITESKTTFKIAKYSYNYLEELQNKISQKMIDKEFTFVTSSAVMEDNNNIKVTVISNKENDLNKIKSLDTIGGAIDIEYNTSASAKPDLLIEKE